ncbi:response regulator [Zooshikella harenae]|uniref:histidine kinase n=1 Tax=Zooshikella harenae TaxID=2827238 RepID=A0ABS5ZHZ3_9GAMM|nr:response regulator [Zooshikella harenae]MBU2713590.1 response regulator [Zooshikella harenae]
MSSFSNYLKNNHIIAAVIVLFLLLVTLSVTLFYIERGRIYGEYNILLQSEAEKANSKITSTIESLKRDLFFLASTPPIRGIARASYNNNQDPQENSNMILWKKRLNTIFSGYINTHQNIRQVRYIGVFNKGKELVRVNYENGKITVVNESDLQNKADRDYYIESLKLKAGEVYVSEINLNRERGVVEKPYQPTLRMTTPIYSANNEYFGMLVINYNAEALFEALQEGIPENYLFYLTKKSGEYLINPEVHKTFSSDLNTNFSWSNEFRKVSGNHVLLDALSVLEHQSQHFLVKSKVSPIYQDHTDKSLILKLAVPEKIVFLNIVKNVSVDILAMFAGIIALSVLFYFYRLTMAEKQRVSIEQARLAAIVESSQDAIVGITLDGFVTDWNKGAEIIFGFNTQEASGKSVLELIIPLDKRDEELRMLETVAQGRSIFQLSSKRQRKDGSLLDVSVSISPVMNKKEEIVGAAKIIRDISQQKAIEEEILKLNSSLELQVAERTAEIQHYLNLQSAILNQAPTAIIITNTDGVITLFNPAAEKMLGYFSSDVVDKFNFFEFIDSNEVAELAQLFSIKFGKVVDLNFDVIVYEMQYSLRESKEWILLKSDKTTFPAYQEITPLIDIDQRVTGYLFIATDMTQQVEDRNKLESMRDQLLKASDVAKLGIWTWDVRTNDLEWNDMMYEIYGINPPPKGENLAFTAWLNALHPDDRKLMHDKVKVAIAEGSKFDPIFRIVKNDESIRYIKSDATIERDKDGNPTIMLGINRDITEQLENEKLLINAKHTADKANIAKSEFVANMSHEIRTPMNAILGMVQLLKKTKLETKQLDYLNKTESAAKVLLGILNDILDFSKMEAGKLVLDPHPCHIDLLLRNVGTISSVNIGNKDIEVLFDIDYHIPETILVDELRLQQILINLTSNAIKFTDKGEVILKVELLEKNNDVVLKFSVIDTGIGISQENLKQIFNDFSQAEASTTRRFGGTGLGLAICQRLVHLMDGELVVESELNKGSTFSFSIQCKVVESPCHLDTQKVKDKLRSVKQIKLLIIDDNEYMRTLLVKMTQAFGWYAEAVKDGEDAISKLCSKNKQYDCILVDSSMPEMDGFDTVTHIKSFFPKQNWPIIIMMTVHQTKALQDRLTEYKEIETVLTKPITASTLFDAVFDAVSPKKEDFTDISEVMSERLKNISILLAEDNLTNQQVAKELLELEGAEVHLVSDGEVAVNILKDTNYQFDVVLMDIQMPRMDGYTATVEIRNTLGLKSLPIIAMTANVMETDKEKAFSLGMNSHIGKPFDLEQVVSKILLEVSKYKNTQYNSMDTENVAKTDISLPLLDEQEALSRLGGAQRIYLRALDNFLQEMPRLIAQLPMEDNPQNPETTANKLHAIKGMASTVGAKAVAHLSANLEQRMRHNDHSDYHSLIKQLKVLIESTNNIIEKRAASEK